MGPAAFPSLCLTWTPKCVAVVLGEEHETGFYESSSPVAQPLGTAQRGRPAGRRHRHGPPGSRVEAERQRGCVTCQQPHSGARAFVHVRPVTGPFFSPPTASRS